jgi:hypothetical protein
MPRPNEKIFSCPARQKIMQFFSNSPASIDTLRGIMTWTGLTKKEAVKALEELVKEGVLTPHRTSSTVGYAYTPDKKMSKKIIKYFDKDGR